MEDQEQVFKILRNIIIELGEELRWPKQRFVSINPKTSLDRDLGLDSLSRVELASRVERSFGITLGEKLFLKIETLDDLVRSIIAENKNSDVINAMKYMSKKNIEFNDREIQIPVNAKTLIDVLEFYQENAPDRQHIIFLESSHTITRISYRELYDKSKITAAVFIKKGVKKGDTIGIMLPTSESYFYSFFGAILAGGVPVAIYPPVRPSQLMDHIVRHGEVLKNSGAKILVTDKSALGAVGQLLKIGLGDLEILDGSTDLQMEIIDATYILAKETDTAFIQYTSGSTGAPKGVVISHANIMANIRAMGEVLGASPADVFVSWLPLYHDMGLIGAWLGSLYFACPLVVMSPFSFLSKPSIWLEAIQEFHGTITAAPNFAYELCIKHVSNEDAKKIDLSSLRVMCNGAEPVSAKTVRRFNDRFKPSGLRPTALLPVYGLAECTVGLAFPKVNSGAMVESISRKTLEHYSRAEKCDAGDPDAAEMVSCGHVLPGHEMRIIDETGHEAPERHEGQIQFKGPSATSGYLNNESETRKLFNGSWLDSGDLGYMAGGQIFVTGRIKDLIKIAGRNIHPEEIEMVIGDLSGVRKGCVAVFGLSDEEAGTERLVIVAETREDNKTRRLSLCESIRNTVFDKFGSEVRDIKLVKPHTLLKTSSGKLRRSACKQMFQNGRLDKPTRYTWFSLFIFGFIALFKRLLVRISRWLAITRSVLVWSGVVIWTIFLWPFYVFLPNLNQRWLVSRLVAWISLLLAGVRLKIHGNQPPGPAIYVANHTSYSDIVYLLAALKYPVSFVAKAELKTWTPVKFTLDRLQVIYVERYELESSLRDAKQITRYAKRGKSILIFPEGTFHRSPGLMPFHVGAFCAAVDSGIPLVPIVIHGARSILHPGSWLIRPGSVTVEILDKIEPVQQKQKKDRWKISLALQKKARDMILEKCGESDVG